MDTKKMNEIFSDQAFTKSLLEMETVAQVQAELKKKGLDVTEQDVLKLRDDINKHVESKSNQGEMSLDQLDDVAGGASSPSHIIEAIEILRKLRW